MFLYCDPDCFGRVSQQRKRIVRRKPSTMNWPIPAGRSVSVGTAGSAAACDGPLLGRGGVRISAPHDFTAQLLVAHQVRTES